MKKILTVLSIFTLAFVMGANAQTKREAPKSNMVVVAGVNLTEDVAIENLEVGKTFGRNTFAVVGQTYQVGSSDRAWSTGVKYYRTIVKTNGFSFFTNGTVLVNLTGPYNSLTFKPGGSVDLAKSLALQANVSTPIYEGSNLFKPTNLEAGLHLVFTLN
jgi:hypothetical protein